MKEPTELIETVGFSDIPCAITGCTSPDRTRTRPFTPFSHVTMCLCSKHYDDAYKAVFNYDNMAASYRLMFYELLLKHAEQEFAFIEDADPQSLGEWLALTAFQKRKFILFVLNPEKGVVHCSSNLPQEHAKEVVRKVAQENDEAEHRRLRQVVVNPIELFADPKIAKA